jgi:hypothetical protein
VIVREFKIDTVQAIKNCADRNEHEVPLMDVARQAMLFEGVSPAMIKMLAEPRDVEWTTVGDRHGNIYEPAVG